LVAGLGARVLLERAREDEGEALEGLLALVCDALLLEDDAGGGEARDDGAVLLDGNPLDRYSTRESAKRVAVLAQHNYYNFDFTVLDVVLMGRSPHKKAMERDNAEDYRIVREALRLVGMQDFEERSFSTLSGGEQQRVILARALAQETPCLILDEPTNHMDVKYQLQLMEIVKGLNCTVLAAVHDLNIAALYFTHLYVMKDGKIVASGSPEEVLTPALIREVYEVEAEVFRDRNGLLRILYQPSFSATRESEQRESEEQKTETEESI
jgi:iron complex transport system ATP-binding protein